MQIFLALTVVSAAVDAHSKVEASLSAQMSRLQAQLLEQVADLAATHAELERLSNQNTLKSCTETIDTVNAAYTFCGNGARGFDTKFPKNQMGCICQIFQAEGKGKLTNGPVDFNTDRYEMPEAHPDVLSGKISGSIDPKISIYEACVLGNRNVKYNGVLGSRKSNEEFQKNALRNGKCPGFKGTGERKHIPTILKVWHDGWARKGQEYLKTHNWDGSDKNMGDKSTGDWGSQK